MLRPMTTAPTLAWAASITALLGFSVPSPPSWSCDSRHEASLKAHWCSSIPPSPSGSEICALTLPTGALLLGARAGLGLVDRQLGGRVHLEPPVRDRLTTADREAVGARGEALLGAFDRFETALQFVGTADVELVLV